MSSIFLLSPPSATCFTIIKFGTFLFDITSVLVTFLYLHMLAPRQEVTQPCAVFKGSWSMPYGACICLSNKSDYTIKLMVFCKMQMEYCMVKQVNFFFSISTISAVFCFLSSGEHSYCLAKKLILVGWETIRLYPFKPLGAISISF